MPQQAKTHEELIEAFRTILPNLDAKVASILASYPDLTESYFEQGRPQLIRQAKFGRVVAIAILDFLAYAFDRPEGKYIPPSSIN